MAANLLSAYLVLGENELKRNVSIQRLKNRLGDSETLAFSLSEFDAAGKIDVNELWSLLNQWGFDASVRGVFIYNADKLSKEASDIIVEYLDNPDPDLVMLLIADKFDKRRLLYKKLTSIAPSALIDCKQPDDRELPKLAQQLAQSYGLHLVGPAAQELVSRVGSSTLQLDNQLRQLSNIAHSTHAALDATGMIPMSVEQIRSQVKRVAEVKPWPFLDAVCARSFSLVSEQLAFFDLSSAVYGLHSLLIGRIRELICVKSCAERGELMKAASELNKQEWIINKYANWTRSWTMAELEEALIGGCGCERALKGSQDSENSFISWVAQMCGVKH
ncbi:MAG: DNA polymerase III subunit delta [Atopobiaceae bacterium]|nr:DNA polymerase III subunit delta [Atopobiaceae bacterium]